MANKFLNILSDKVVINKNKIIIATDELGLEENKDYDVVLASGVLDNITEAPEFKYGTGERNVPPLPEGYIWLPSGRAIGRHESNEGSVLVYDFYGTEKAVFIPDCKYRSVTQFGSYESNPSGIPTMQSNANGTNMLMGPDSQSALFEDGETKTVTDAQLQAIWPSLSSLNSDPSVYTTAWMTKNSTTDSKSVVGVPATSYVRGITSIEGFDSGLDLPDHYLSMVIRLEAKYIDQFDKYKEDTTCNKYLLSKEYNPNNADFTFGDVNTDYNEGYGGAHQAIREFWGCFSMSWNAMTTTVNNFGGCGQTRSNKALALPIKTVTALNVLP